MAFSHFAVSDHAAIVTGDKSLWAAPFLVLLLLSPREAFYSAAKLAGHRCRATYGSMFLQAGLTPKADKSTKGTRAVGVFTKMF